LIENGDVCKTLQYCLEQSIQSKENEIIVVIGSFYLMSEVRQCLGFQDEKDPIF
jgi:folylpolyglutamate synthase/dihydropteroate synthase